MATYGVPGPSTLPNGTSLNEMPPLPPPRSLAPPPNGQFSTREEALTYLKSFAAPQGYAVVIKRSRQNRLWMRCDRGGSSENRPLVAEGQRKRKHRESRLMGCPFKVVVAYKADADIWRTEVVIAEHNHPPSEDFSEHPTLRRMTAEQTKKMEELTDREYTPQETLDELKRIWPDIQVLNRDLYNARKKYKTQKAMQEAEAAANAAGDQLMQQQSQGQQLARPYIDPNEQGMPGPTPYGKWVWVTDSQEVVKKPKYRRQRDRLLERQQAEDGAAEEQQQQQPQQQHLQQQQAAPAAPMTPAARGRGRPPRSTNLTPTSNVDPALTSSQPPDSSQHHLPPSSFDESSLASTQLLQQQAISQLAQFLQPNNHSSHHQPGAAATAAAAAAQSPQAQESRLEKLEREQRNTTTMLNQILGAVQGMRGGDGRT